MFKIILNIIDKGLEIFKIFLKEGFELRLNNEINIFMAIFVISSSKINDTTKKLNNK